MFDFDERGSQVIVGQETQTGQVHDDLKAIQGMCIHKSNWPRPQGSEDKIC